MRKNTCWFIVLFFLTAHLCAFAQRPVPVAYTTGINVNYVRTWDATAPENNSNFLTTRPLQDAKMTTQYIDGLGRPLQTVIKQGSLLPNGSATDMVMPVEYDEYAREQYKYLPYPEASAADGSFKISPFAAQATFMNTQYGAQGETYFYSQTKFEASPLNRVEKTLAPGNNWIGSNRGPEIKNLYNTVTDNVKIWDIKAALSLYITVTNLNNGNQSVTWAINNLSSGNINTIAFLYRASGSTGAWTTAYAGNPTNGTVTYNIPVGNYEYAVQIYYTDSTPTTLVGEGSPIALSTYSTANSYPAGRLYKTIQTDEHGKQAIEFKNKEGLVLLKKLQLTAQADDGTGSGYTGWLCTYYLYDDYNNLRCVIQPRGVELISSNWSLTDQTILDEQCFRYEYDSRKHVIVKKVPGAAPVYIVYDQKGRLILTQDGNMRVGTVKWQYIQYDDLDRPVTSGLWNNAQTVTYHIRNAYNNTIYPDLSGQTYEVLTQSFYDDYEWLATNGNPFSSSISTSDLTLFSATSTSWPYPQAVQQSSETSGMLTGSKIKVLGTSNYLYAINYFDDKGRMLQMQAQNITNGVDISTNQYNWAGQIMRSVLRQQIGGTVAQTSIAVTNNTYDDLGRLIKIEKKSANSNINSGAVPTDYKTVASYQYDALGQMSKKLLGTIAASGGSGGASLPELANLTYQYNIRGWVLSLNKDFVAASANTNQYFGFELGYDKNAGFGTFAAQYNGNISGTTWKSAGDLQQRKYDFTYDAVNRLTAASFTQYVSGSGTAAVFNTSAGVDFSVSNLSYDANGNILTMWQKGLQVNTSGLIDQLTYNYKPNSNKLLNVIDGVNASSTKLGDFRASAFYQSVTPTKTSTTEDYIYDDNGNLIIDKNKDIGIAVNGNSGIMYNYLNLPSAINVKKDATTDKGTITYTYDASGNKLKKITVDNGVTGKTVTTSTIYIAGLMYESKTTNPADAASPDYTNVLQFIPQEEGRIRFKPLTGTVPAAFAYDYFIKDHLGNVRMVLTEEQTMNLYPAATLEGTYSATGQTQANSMINTEKQYYNIDNTKVVAESSIASWVSPAETVANTKLYYNNNGNPPANSNYPSGCTPTQTDGSSKLYKLNATTNKTGLEFMIKVMAGDKIDIFGKSYYLNTTQITNANSTVLDVAGLMANFLLAPANPAGGKGFTSSVLTSSNTGLIPPGFFRGNNSESSTTVPKAYINYIFFDEQFKYAGGGYSRVGTSGTVKDHWQADASLQSIAAPKNGYIFVYVSNESNFDVFFDNLQVIHKPGAILEETHYYPFGLMMAGISSKAAGTLLNKIKYNGKELQSGEFSDGSGLEWTDYGARMYDNQIGRWMVIDAMSEKTESITPYNYGLNSPVNYVDVKGYFSILHHHDFTYNALKKFGYNSDTRDLVSHYASTYADNPTGFKGALIRFWENSPRWSGIDYSPTENSQNTASIENSTWHSMRADGENITNDAAMARGQEFGWNKIFEASSEIKKVGGMENLKKNSKGIQALGQGVHALQDAVAHQGTDMDNHDTWKDMQPGKKLYDQASNVTEGAFMVTEIMSGNSNHLTNGMSINITGMTSNQLQTLTTNLIDLMQKKDGVTKVYLTTQH